MQQLTSEGQEQVTALAQRYGVSTEAVVTLLQALVHGHGTMAQFDHPELGGRGQWMPGGMVMAGDMFNQALKATVDGLCTALASLLAASPLVPEAPARSPLPCEGIPPPQQRGGVRPAAESHAPAKLSGFVASPAGGAGVWWPAELGMPAASGAQNAMRYAYFPAQRRFFTGRILPVDQEVATRWGIMTGEAERVGHPIPVLDGLVAATAAVAGLTLATRNTLHMQHTGAVVFDPWTG